MRWLVTGMSSGVFALLIALWAIAASAADERQFGDVSLRPKVEARTRSIYEAGSRPETSRRFLFTTDNLLAVPEAVGTEASATSGTTGDRLVATVWSKTGKYSVEYYRSPEGVLLFVYETFVYFTDTAPSDAWRNFMGLAAWERRIYFDDNHAIGYATSQGKHAPPPGSGAAELREQAVRLAKAFAR
jgi:hypothetical protein